MLGTSKKVPHRKMLMGVCHLFRLTCKINITTFHQLWLSSHCQLKTSKTSDRRPKSTWDILYAKITWSFNHLSYDMLEYYSLIYSLWKNSFEVINSHVVVRKYTEKFYVSFTQFHPMVTYQKTLMQYYNQEINIKIVKLQNISVITSLTHVSLI